MSGLVIGSGFLRDKLLVQEPQKQKHFFRDPFSPQEFEDVKQSVMAGDMENYLGKGYSCAGMILLVSLRYLGKPEEWVHAAAAFGGGMGRGDLCGLLSGGMMAIGFASGMLNPDDLKALHRDAREWSNIYWDWWQQWGPVHCRTLKNQYKGPDEFLRMGKRVAVKIESLTKPAVKT